MSPEGSALTLSRLLRRAAAVSPEKTFTRAGPGVEGTSGRLRAIEIDRAANRYAVRLLDTYPPEDARAAILGVPEASAIAAIVGAIRAGVGVVLTPPGLDHAAIAAAADLAGATALAGPTRVAGLDLGQRLFQAGARMPTVGLVALWGQSLPGALALDAEMDLPMPSEPPTREADLLAIDTSVEVPRALMLSQARMWESAEALIGAGGINADSTIVSLISLASPAGLVCGAFAPLICGAQVVWQAPFDARRLVEILDAYGPAHLAAPASTAADLGAAGLLTTRRVASLTLAIADPVPDPIFDHSLDPAYVLRLRTDDKFATRFVSPSEMRGRRAPAAKFG